MPRFMIVGAKNADSAFLYDRFEVQGDDFIGERKGNREIAIPLDLNNDYLPVEAGKLVIFDSELNKLITIKVSIKDGD